MPLKIFRSRISLFKFIFSCLALIFTYRFLSTKNSNLNYSPKLNLNNINKPCEIKDLTCHGLGTILTNREKAKDVDELWSSRQELVVKAFKHAWQGYYNYSFGYDEYFPLEKRGENFIKDGGLGFTIIDSLDTMILMGLEQPFNVSLQWIEEKLSFDLNGYVNLFETTIRVLGGLLSSDFLTQNQFPILLQRAKELSLKLEKAFNTSSGIPEPTIHLLSGEHQLEGYCSTAEATTLQLEMKYLAFLLKDSNLFNKVDQIMDILDNQYKLDGLVPISISTNTGIFNINEIRLGSRGDSYYEYLLKQYLQSNKLNTKFKRMYDTSVEGIKKWLIGYSQPNHRLFLGEITLDNPTQLSPKMDHLVCFMAGNLALGATEGKKLSSITLSPHDEEDLKLAEALMETCWYTYTMNPTGLAAEITMFNTEATSQQDAYVKHLDTHNLLRPETIESLFILYRITGNIKYREWGWTMFQSFQKYAFTEHGYVSLKDITVVPAIQSTKMETFFLAETLKYFYLLFANENFLDLDKVVLNTEAHPLPRFIWLP